MEFEFVPSAEDLRRRVLRIIRNTPNKELAAHNIADAIFRKLSDQMEAHIASLKADSAKRQKEMDKKTKEMEKTFERQIKKMDEFMEEAKRDMEEGEEWKS